MKHIRQFCALNAANTEPFLWIILSTRCLRWEKRLSLQKSIKNRTYFWIKNAFLFEIRHAFNYFVVYKVNKYRLFCG